LVFVLTKAWLRVWVATRCYVSPIRFYRAARSTMIIDSTKSMLDGYRRRVPACLGVPVGHDVVMASEASLTLTPPYRKAAIEPG
jgi:hypothetical protein